MEQILLILKESTSERNKDYFENQDIFKLPNYR